ncbi:hypothetical protein N7472_008212 [Penicillium cf. griseofulvum]|uniref:Uncharacterized protein n=1 Tax=Penicillium cf. griseofulvum TaxID=2972120 RepID=A0A9W9J3C1_9EURO|nr:hypothetical protein N7472_008212 [Penicillium cf. griseofulvum]
MSKFHLGEDGGILLLFSIVITHPHSPSSPQLTLDLNNHPRLPLFIRLLLITPPLAIATPSHCWCQPTYFPRLKFKLNPLRSFFQLLDSLPLRRVSLHNLALAPETAELTHVAAPPAAHTI